VTFDRRQARVRAFDALEDRIKQFRGYEDVWPFRIPHEPLALDEVLAGVAVEPEALRSRTVLSFEWSDGSRWELWAIAMPSGISVYCDAGGGEVRVLASVRRGNPLEADGFMLELLAESRGAHFGIELVGDAPARVRTSIADREFLVDVFVELFEGSEAERSISKTAGEDFRDAVTRWLAGALGKSSQPPARSARRQLRRNEARDH
jgi:hypothetical protein